jgi:uncharacterized SAM-binding protein YcdF (DUF218 family)
MKRQHDSIMKIKQIKHKKYNKIKRLVKVAAFIGLLSFIIIECLILFNGRSDAGQRTDYAIILGGGIRGEKVSLALEERLKTGIVYLRKYPDTKVIVSGGQGRGEFISEAEAMKRYLISKGIDGNRIICEDKSTSTMENFSFSKQILLRTDGRNIKTITVITNNFHMLRAKMLAGRNGFIPLGISGKTPLPAVPLCYVREYFALVKSFFIDR